MAAPPKKLASRFTNSTENVWVRFNEYSKTYGEVNLGPGKPDFAPTEYIQRTLSEVALDGNDFQQYTREQGHPRLVKAIAELHSQLLGRSIDPMNEVIVTHGAYESLCISFLSLVNPGDEVILIEPFYDCYQTMTTMAGGIPVYVPLKPSVDPPRKSSDWILDPAELECKFTAKTKLIVFSNPNNPIGKVYSKEELELIAKLCIKHDVVSVTDEVYEWLVYTGMEQTRLSTIPGMWERSITISSASKSFSVTGWRVGWSIGCKELIDCLMIAHQNSDCFCTTPAQEAVARCIETEIPRLKEPTCHFTSQMDMLHKKRDLLFNMLKEAGFTSCMPDAGYFIIADWTSLATNDMIEDGSCDSPDVKFAKWLVRNHKMVSIPTSVFYEEHKSVVTKYVRFCFFRTDEALTKAESYFGLICKAESD